MENNKIEILLDKKNNYSHGRDILNKSCISLGNACPSRIQRYLT
jgi:hypothetical protein